MSRRRRIAVAGAGVLLLLGLVRLATLGRAAEPAPAAPAALAAPEPAPPPPALTAEGAVSPEEVAAAIEQVPVLGSVAGDAAQSYRERARFPQWSHPIRDGVDPVLRDREITPGRSLPADLEPVLTVAPDRMSFEHPGPIRIRARLSDQGTALRPRELRGEVRSARGEVVAALDLQDDGREGDARAGDGEYLATLDVADSAGHAWKGSYLVEVWAITPEGESRNATTGFLYSVPKGRLTGRFQDSVEGGDLTIDAQIEVWEDARFHVEGTLAAPDGQPLAWAENAAPLPPGNHWLPLRFYGLALREGARDGPYRLRSVALTTAGEMPNQKSEVLRDAYETRPHRATDFRDDPFEDPTMLRAAEALEGRGVR